MLTLQQTMESQSELEKLCADRPLQTNEIFQPNTYYGIDMILKAYTGLPAGRPLKAVVPHGLVLSSDYIWEAEMRVALPAVLCYPAYRENAYRQCTTKLVIPSASPFLYLLELLKTNRSPTREGTIFFPAHSTHHVTADFDFEGLADALLLLGEEYQPITVCVYWRDFNLGRHLAFLERGFRVVSAGHMFDPRFLVRFYHLCSLHHYSASNAIGSNLFYSIKAGCSFFLVHGFGVTRSGEPEVLKRDTPKIPDSMQLSLHALFSNPRSQMTPEQLQTVDYYLGIENVKSPRTLRQQLCYAEFLDYAGFFTYNGGRRIRPLIPHFYGRVGRKLLRWSEATISVPRR